MIDKRLTEQLVDSYYVVRIGSRSEPADRQVIGNCVDYFRLGPQGYQPTADVDAAAMKVDGAKCEVIRTLRGAKSPARRNHLTLTADSLTELPASLAPAPSPMEVETREAAGRLGISWLRYDTSATLAATDSFHARVTASDSVTDLEILAEADFDGDGTGDALLLTVSASTKGSWRDVHLRLVSRNSGTTVLRVLKDFPL